MLDKITDFIAKPIPQQILFFHEMLTPSLIRIAYWLCLLAVVWTGLGKVFGGSFSSFLEGIVFIAAGGILARVGAEIIMLFFQMNENLETMAKNSAPVAGSAKKVTKKVAKKASKKVTKKSV